MKPYGRQEGSGLWAQPCYDPLECGPMATRAPSGSSGTSWLWTVAAVLGGVVGAVMLADHFKSQRSYACPACSGSVRHGTETCPHCHRRLKWT